MFFAPVPADELAFAMTLFVSASDGLAAASLASAGAGQAGRKQRRRSVFSGVVVGHTGFTERARAAQACLKAACFQLFTRCGTLRWGFEPEIDSGAYPCVLLGDGAQPRCGAGALDDADPARRGKCPAAPAVVEALACVALTASGALSESAFLRTIQECCDAVHADAGAVEERVEQERPAAVEGSARRWPIGQGEMAALIAGHDWSATAMGPVEGLDAEPAHVDRPGAGMQFSDDRALGTGPPPVLQ